MQKILTKCSTLIRNDPPLCVFLCKVGGGYIFLILTAVNMEMNVQTILTLVNKYDSTNL